MANSTFNIILFHGRPASGKSEVIDCITNTKTIQRKKDFFIKNYSTIDDFEYLWEKGIEDDFLQELGKKRIFTDLDPTGYSVKNKVLYDFMIKKINMEYKNKYHNTNFFRNNSLFIEFSRGGKAAYKKSYNLLCDEILTQCVIVYVDVSYKESIRKNKRRYDKNSKGSILHHTLPKKIMETYKIDDWANMTKNDKNFIKVRNHCIPYFSLTNEPEITNKISVLRKELKKGFKKIKFDFDEIHK